MSASLTRPACSPHVCPQGDADQLLRLWNRVHFRIIFNVISVSFLRSSSDQIQTNKKLNDVESEFFWCEAEVRGSNAAPRPAAPLLCDCPEGQMRSSSLLLCNHLHHLQCHRALICWDLQRRRKDIARGRSHTHTHTYQPVGLGMCYHVTSSEYPVEGEVLIDLIKGSGLSSRLWVR